MGFGAKRCERVLGGALPLLLVLLAAVLAGARVGEGAGGCRRDEGSLSSWPPSSSSSYSWLRRAGPFDGEPTRAREVEEAAASLVREVGARVERAGGCFWATHSSLRALVGRPAFFPYDPAAHLAALASDYVKLTSGMHEMAEEEPKVEVETSFAVKHIRVWLRDEQGNKLTHTDIFFYELGADGMLRHPWQEVALEADAVFPLRQAAFHDGFLWAPHDPERVLRALYGDTFATPRKIFDWASMAYVPNNEARTESYPLVSVIIPTHARAQFLTMAIELVGRQDYPNLEIVIVDDSDTPLPADQVAALRAKGHTYTHLAARASIGTKRNLAVSQAKGQVIVHWDDDDYFREHRITAQVAPILSGQVDMTVLEHHYYFHLSTRTFFVVKRASSWGPHFGTFVYRKELFVEGIRYPDNSLAEDYAFAEEALSKGASIRVLNNEDGKHVYVRHQNTWNFNFEDYDAQVTKVERPSFFAEPDFNYFCSIEAGAPSQAPRNYASEKIQWNRAELHPEGAAPGYGPTYPSYQVWKMSLVAKVGIGVGVAAGVALIILCGLAGFCYTQWRKKKEIGYMPINNEDFD